MVQYPVSLGESTYFEAAIVLTFVLKRVPFETPAHYSMLTAVFVICSTTSDSHALSGTPEKCMSFMLCAVMLCSGLFCSVLVCSILLYSVILYFIIFYYILFYSIIL